MTKRKGTKTMSPRSEQSKVEYRVFSEFVHRSKLPVPLESIENRPPPEPDIRCNVSGEGPAAFELKEICDEGIAKTCADLSHNVPENAQYVRPGNPVSRISRKAKGKQYRTECPVELLLYTNGRIVLPADVIIPDLRRQFECAEHQFRRVWFMGEPNDICECIWGPPPGPD